VRAARKAANMVFTTVTEPLVRRDAEQLGIETLAHQHRPSRPASLGAGIGGGFAGFHGPARRATRYGPGGKRRYDADASARR
jgi:hypothetical protein